MIGTAEILDAHLLFKNELFTGQERLFTMLVRLLAKGVTGAPHGRIYEGLDPLQNFFLSRALVEVQIFLKWGSRPSWVRPWGHDYCVF